MADLVTHFGVAYLVCRWLPDPRARVLCYGGAILPDVCFRAAVLGAQSALWFAEPTHSLWGALLLSYAASLLFARAWRARAFGWILAGYGSHLLIDLGKDNLGMGAILLFFPSMRTVEWGVYSPEASAGWAAAWFAGVLLAEVVHPTLFPRRRPLFG